MVSEAKRAWCACTARAGGSKSGGTDGILQRRAVDGGGGPHRGLSTGGRFHRSHLPGRHIGHTGLHTKTAGGRIDPRGSRQQAGRIGTGKGHGVGCSNGVEGFQRGDAHQTRPGGRGGGRGGHGHRASWSRRGGGGCGRSGARRERGSGRGRGQDGWWDTRSRGHLLDVLCPGMPRRKRWRLDLTAAQTAGRPWHRRGGRRMAGSRPGQCEDQQEGERDDAPAWNGERMATQVECSSTGVGSSVRVGRGLAYTQNEVIASAT